MYTKTLAAVLVIATAHASRLTARAGGRGDVSIDTSSLSIWWPPKCEVRKTFSYKAPELWYAASVPDLMDCTKEQSKTGTWQNDAEYRLTLSGYDSICRLHETVGNVDYYKYECLEAGWYQGETDYNDAWCNDHDRKYYEFTKDPNNPDCVKWQTDNSDPDLPRVCNDFNRWVCPPEYSG